MRRTPRDWAKLTNICRILRKGDVSRQGVLCDAIDPSVELMSRSSVARKTAPSTPRSRFPRSSFDSVASLLSRHRTRRYCYRFVVVENIVSLGRHQLKCNPLTRRVTIERRKVRKRDRERERDRVCVRACVRMRVYVCVRARERVRVVARRSF